MVRASYRAGDRRQRGSRCHQCRRPAQPTDSGAHEASSWATAQLAATFRRQRRRRRYRSGSETRPSFPMADRNRPWPARGPTRGRLRWPVRGARSPPPPGRRGIRSGAADTKDGAHHRTCGLHRALDLSAPDHRAAAPPGRGATTARVANPIRAVDRPLLSNRWSPSAGPERRVAQEVRLRRCPQAVQASGTTWGTMAAACARRPTFNRGRAGPAELGAGDCTRSGGRPHSHGSEAEG